MNVLFCVGVVRREVNCDLLLFGFAGIGTFVTNLTVPSKSNVISSNIIPVYLNFNEQKQISFYVHLSFFLQIYHILYIYI